MDLGGAGEAGKGLAAVIAALGGLRGGRSSGAPPTRQEFDAAIDAVGDLVEVVRDLTMLVGQQGENIDKAARIAMRADRVALILAAALAGDLTKKQRKRLRRASHLDPSKFADGDA